MIELLVVIGIIALLASLLAPALSRAKSQSYSTQCMNNMRQIGLATRLYAEDNSDYLPFENIATLDSLGPGWCYNDWAGLQSDGMTTGLLWPLIGNTNVYFCPLDRAPRLMPDPSAADPNSAPWIPRWMNCSSYCMTGFANGGTYNFQSLKWTDFSSRAFCYWECNEQGDWASWNDACNFGSEGCSHHHSDGGNTVSFDSHVERVSYANFMAELNNRPGRIYCNPLSSDGYWLP